MCEIPLAIRIIASLLYGQCKSRWRSFRDIDLIHLKQDGVLPVLKLSYYHLEPPLKSCFNYCALFPTDYEVEKKTLIRLWVAQGFIVPSYGLSVEETGEEYFLTLLHRGFFQDAGKTSNGELVSCKIPAVMHNLAQEASKLEISVANSNTSQLNGKIRHLSVEKLDAPEECFGIQGNANCPVKSLRTFFKLYCVGLKKSMFKNIMSKGRCFRVLDLQGTYFKRLPTFNKMLHIRYLDLSQNRKLQVLPNSLAKLHNLQTLILNLCCELIELPLGMRKLVNLKHLELYGCNSLTHLPPGLNCLTNLQTLTNFVVGQVGLIKQGAHGVCSELNDLKSLINLKGSLTITLRKVITNTAIVEGARYLTSMEHLSTICLDWSYSEDKDDNHEALLNGLQPPYNLKYFHLKGYPGTIFPSWGSLENSLAPLSNLLEIFLNSCTKLQHLPSMRQLPYLKMFKLESLVSLEYIENNENDDIMPPTPACSRFTTSDGSLFFPSLEELRLKDLPELKGWWRSSGKQQQSELASMSFPRLSVLQIHNCPILTSIPLCHNVEDMELIKFDESLSLFNISNKKVVPDVSSSSNTNNLKRLMIDNVGYLNSWPVQYLQQLQYMEIQNARLQSLSTVGKVFQFRVTSLLSLDISCCSQLRSLSEGGLEHLTALETLRFFFLQTLSLNVEDVMPWKSLCHSLRSLEFVNLPEMVNLPKGMQYLTTLRSLKISECSSLEALPEWLSHLSSLQSLTIRGGRLKALPKAMQDLTFLRSLSITSCSASLKARCEKCTGEDWLKIQHIPNVTIL